MQSFRKVSHKMSEKKQVLYNLRVTYNGSFVVDDFYAEVDNWAKEKGFEKEPKQKMEHVTKDGKKLHLIMEVHSHLDELHHGIVVLKAMMDNVKDAVIKRQGKKIRINNGDVYIDINGFVESHLHGTFYQIKPMYWFIRSLIDRFVYKFWSDKYDGEVSGQCHELYKRLRSFFELQKYKYQ